jgi:hypothetical protein
MPRRRGGDYDADRRAERNQANADLAVAEFGTAHVTPGQARRLARKAQRKLNEARNVEGEPDLAQDAINWIRASGLAPIGARTLYTLLSEPVD